MVLRAILFLAPAMALAADAYLFTSFRRNGETGAFFAISDDGYKWAPVKGNQAVVPPKFEGMLMRDPFVVKGPGGKWHMLWTTGWTRAKTGRLTIGHAETANLAEWGAQQMIDISLEGARNAWAPEMVWDEKKKEWVIFWASTIEGKYPDVEGPAAKGNNHRIYAMRTADFVKFTAPELWFDPGYNCIDSTVEKVGERWVMVFKDERVNPQQKKLRLAWAKTAAGPWSEVGEPFTMDWIEGPSVVRQGEDWLVYFDHYAKPHFYGAYRTRDWKKFEDVSKKMEFPGDHRHGTVVRISEAEAAALKALR
jgi:hypothetical protein